MTRRHRLEFGRDEDGNTDYRDRREIPIDQWEGTWMSHTPHDLTGRAIVPGDWLVKTFQSGRSCNMEIRRVREVRPPKVRKLEPWETEQDMTPRVFLDDSKVPVKYPGRCLVIDWDPEKEQVRPAGPDAGDRRV